MHLKYEPASEQFDIPSASILAELTAPILPTRYAMDDKGKGGGKP